MNTRIPGKARNSKSIYPSRIKPIRDRIKKNEYMAIQNIAAGRSFRDRLPDFIFTAIKIGCRSKNAFSTAIISKTLAKEKFSPANKPIKSGLSTNTHDP